VITALRLKNIMALKKILEVTGTCVPAAGDDVDTDRIIPARYLKCVTFDGLGEFLFYDVRFDENGQPTNCSLNDARFQGATIMIAGRNFGCGSSREHAPQAIYRSGFRAIVAESFAEIFFGNSTTLSIPCVTVSRHDLDRIREIVESEPKTEMTIDLTKETIRLGRDEFPASVLPSARDALINGRWDPIADLLEARDSVEERVAQLSYMAPG
jgi:3-isopropylmalate/(R)-2-methylmalate dehydratase small subunit